MRNLSAFIERFSNVLIFIVLQAICFGMIIRSNKKVHQTIVSSSNSIAGGLYNQKKGFTDYLHLREMNDSLLKENQNLRKQLIQETATIPIMDSTGTISYKRDSINKTIRYRFYAAKVVDNTFDEPNNYVTLNRGQYNGIKPGMAVLSNNSIVGVVKTVGPHYCVAKTVISQKNRVTAQFSDGTIGYLSWPDIDCRFAQLNDVSLSKIAKHGDSVFTSLYSTTYPPGIFIGKIAAVVPSSSANNFTVALATNFKRLQYAYIVEDITVKEITALQDSTLAMDNPPKPNKK